LDEKDVGFTTLRNEEVMFAKSKKQFNGIWYQSIQYVFPHPDLMLSITGSAKVDEFATFYLPFRAIAESASLDWTHIAWGWKLLGIFFIGMGLHTLYGTFMYVRQGYIRKPKK